MAKAVLVIDMPERCLDCIMRNENDVCVMQSPEANEKYSTWGELKEHCPLKPMPEKHTFFTGISRAWKEGWNACIDAICGEE